MISVILAGGSGTRFWPISRTDQPKQLLRLTQSGRVMIAETIARLPGEDVLVVLGDHLLRAAQRALPELEEENFLVEPTARNTLPAIALAAVLCKHRHGDRVLGIFPSDHMIHDVEAFHDCLEVARAAAAQGAIVTLGIPPTRAETGYGYIEIANPNALKPGESTVPVERFVEKPDRPTAQDYLEAGSFLWNSGMFLFRPSTLLEEIGRQKPVMADRLRQIEIALGTEDEQLIIDSVFPTLESISIDYGVMENAERVEVLPASFRWSDVGHWDALDEVLDPDGQGNVIEAENTLLIDSHDNVIYAQGQRRLIATVGVDNLVIVDAGDALLILPRDRAQDVRAVVEELRKRDLDHLL